MAEIETAYLMNNLSISDENNYEKTEEEFEEGEIESEAENNQAPDEVLAVLPLEHAWTFWYDNQSGKSKQEAWGSSMQPVHTFSTVQDFWRLCNNIHPPSKLVPGADFYCFKDKIEPKWEDPVCANGGKWTITCQPRGGKIDTYWLYTLLALIGEQFDYGDEICGAVVNVRSRNERISIWTRNAQNEAAQVSIGKQWKGFLDCNDSIGFIVHEDAMLLERNAKNIYTI